MKTSMIIAAAAAAMIFSACSENGGKHSEESSSAKEIVSFGFSTASNPELQHTCRGVMIDRTFHVTVPLGCPLSALRADFEASKGTEVRIGDTVIESGFTAADYSSLVTLVAVAEDGSTETYYADVRNGLYQIDEKVLAFMKRYSIPGMSVSIGDAGRMVYSRGYGYACVETRERVEPDYMFRLASVTKPFTGMCIQRLVDDGMLSLDDRPFAAGGVLADDYPVHKPQCERITVRNLLEHTSGWDGSFDPMFSPPTKGFTVGRTVDYSVRNIDFAAEAGTEYRYSNLGYCILGRIIEKVTGESYEEYLREAVLDRVGTTGIRIGSSGRSKRYPRETVYYSQGAADGYSNDMNRLDACAGLVASTEDLLRVLLSIDGRDDYPDIFPASTLERMFTASSVAPHRYALGWSVNHTLYYKGCAYHSGSLAGTAAFWIRGGDGHHTALLCNSRSYDADFDNEHYALAEYLHSYRALPDNDLFAE